MGQLHLLKVSRKIIVAGTGIRREQLGRAAAPSSSPNKIIAEQVIHPAPPFLSVTYS